MPEMNPLLAKIKLPGKVYQLPSRGLFYHDGELESNVLNGEIHVRPMSALAEIHMKNPDQLFSGLAVETVFKECISGIAKPSQLLSKDVDAIMIFLREVTYGSQYEFTATHTCENAQAHSYIANIEQFIASMKMIEPNAMNEFKVTLPNGQLVLIQPTRYSHVVNLLKENVGKSELDVEGMKRNLIMLLSSVVVQVDEIRDPNLIIEWLTQLPATWVNKIADRVEATNDWGPTMKWEGHCKDCGEALSVELPINPVSFFTE